MIEDNTDIHFKNFITVWWTSNQ